MINPSTVTVAAQGLKPFLRQWRRRLHRYPELGFEEHRTAALVARVCRRAGWVVTTGVAQTGVVAVLSSKSRGPVIALRADMDALPIQETARHAYASRVPKVMHACGHDGNTTMALGVATLLGRFKDRLQGRVKLLFQPCEEFPPGGAQAMIKAGGLGRPAPDLIVAAHMDAQLPAGKIGLKPGIVMANVGKFKIRIIGKGGHGAMPHRCVDPVVIAAQVITNLQQIVSRECDPLASEVLTIGRCTAGSAYNVIAEDALLEGTIRSLTPQERRRLPLQIKRIAQAVAKAHRARAEVFIEDGHPALYNDAHATALVQQAALKVLGSKGMTLFNRPLMSGEDFTYFAAQRPACFFHVGGGFKDKQRNHPWHHPQFDFDENGLVTGTAVLTQTVLDYLG